MPAPYTGRCACGSVTATISSEPIVTRQCWCRQCQQIASGGPTNNAMFKADAVELSGDLSSASWPAASGNTLSYNFCPKCGTQVYGQSSARPHIMTFRMGFLDEGHGLSPGMVIWAAEAPPWAAFDPALERRDGQAPPLPPGT